MLGAIVVVAMLGAPVSDSAEQSIQRTVAQMEAAARESDAAQYLLMVDPADPLFEQEQRRWVRDSVQHPVDTLSIRVDPASITRAQDGWFAELTFTWTLPDQPGEHTLDIPARFRPLGLPSGDWVYAGRDWSEPPAQPDDARILIQDDRALPAAEILTERFTELRRAVENEFGLVLPEPPTVKMFTELDAMQASIGLAYTDPLAGWSEPGEPIKLLVRKGSTPQQLEPLIMHELGHLVSFEFGPAITSAPWWVLEGVAELVADPVRADTRRDLIRPFARRGALRPFSDLADFRGAAMQNAGAVYVQGFSMMRYLTDRFGRDRRNAWLHALGRGATIEQASTEVFETPFARIESDWKASLGG